MRITALVLPSINGGFLKMARQLRKRSPFLFWLAAPFLVLFVLVSWSICWPLWRVALKGYDLCAWLGIDLGT